MRDYIELGPAPYNESSVQLSSDADYIPAMRAECARFVAGLEKHFAPILETTSSLRFGIKRMSHEFGTYYEAVVSAADYREEEISIAWEIQDRTPGTWAELENTVTTWRPEELFPQAIPQQAAA